MQFVKKNWSTIFLVGIFVVGVCLIAYPSLSDYWNSFHQSRVIADYADSVASIDDNEYEELWNQAVAYNKKLAETYLHFDLTEEEEKEYNETLDVTGTGIMAYIEIPSIKCSLPIYHGTDEGILQIAIGHITGSSLPVGGTSTHCVLSGHRGLPSAKLFSNLDQLVNGDVFMIHTLDETLTYEVERVNTVLPNEIDGLKIEKGKDLCTLVTCTPYGINTHRLLVRGHRIENVNHSQIRVTPDAIQIEQTVVAPIIAIPILLVLLSVLLTSKRRKRKKLKD